MDISLRSTSNIINIVPLISFRYRYHSPFPPGTAITGLQHRTVVELIKKCGTSVLLGVGTPQLVEGDEENELRNETEEVSYVNLCHHLGGELWGHWTCDITLVVSYGDI